MTDCMANITCSTCQDALIWYSTNQLPEDERQLITRHLETCAACQQELAQWQMLGAQMRQARAVMTPPQRDEIWQGIQGQITHHLPASTSNGAAHMEFEEQATPRLPSAPRKRDQPRQRTWLALVATSLVVALASGVFALHSRPQTGSGAIAPLAGEHPLSRDIGSLNYITMVSPTEGWAIGDRKAPSDCATGTTHPSAGAPMLHYHNDTWWEVDTPYSNHPCATLEALDMLTPDEGWAVGYTVPADPNDWTRCFAMHYTQGIWHDVTMNNCLGVPGALYASSPQDIWMVGGLSPLNANVSYGETYGNGNPTQGTMLLMHYDGHTWQHIIDPHFALAYATTIWGSGAADITILGHDISQDATQTPISSQQQNAKVIQTNLVVHYDGHTWTREAALPSEALNAISLISPHEGWAIGTSFDAKGQANAILVHYHAGIWDAPMKLPSNTYLGAIVMVSPTEGWAVGTSILHYTAGAWKTVIATLPNGEMLTSLSMTSATDGWAVGFDQAATAASLDNGEIVRFTNGTLTTIWHSNH